MSEIVVDIVLSSATFVVGFILGWFALLAFEFVRSFVSKSVGRVKGYLARRGLKAPNGKKTNLTTQQWLAVRTPIFKAWFGD